jgi:hypothetical protein
MAVMAVDSVEVSGSDVKRKSEKNWPRNIKKPYCVIRFTIGIKWSLLCNKKDFFDSKFESLFLLWQSFGLPKKRTSCLEL